MQADVHSAKFLLMQADMHFAKFCCACELSESVDVELQSITQAHHFVRVCYRRQLQYGEENYVVVK